MHLPDIDHYGRMTYECDVTYNSYDLVWYVMVLPNGLSMSFERKGYRGPSLMVRNDNVSPYVRTWYDLATSRDRWYHLRLEVDWDMGTEAVYLDDLLIAALTFDAERKEEFGQARGGSYIHFRVGDYSAGWNYLDNLRIEWHDG